MRVPKDLGDERVAAILQQKRPWIVSKVAELSECRPTRPRNWSVASHFHTRRNYRLKVQDGHQVGVCLTGGYLQATVRPLSRESSVSSESSSIWTLGTSPEHWSDSHKTTRYAKQIGVSPSGISVRNFKSRLGIMRFQRSVGLQLEHHQGTSCDR